jgi:hypothetical protein
MPAAFSIARLHTVARGKINADKHLCTPNPTKLPAP